jgi:hypothetical protein
VNWRKSSRSGASGDNSACVEVAHCGELVAIRDSKNPTATPLTVPARAFSRLRTACGS